MAMGVSAAFKRMVATVKITTLSEISLAGDTKAGDLFAGVICAAFGALDAFRLRMTGDDLVKVVRAFLTLEFEPRHPLHCPLPRSAGKG